MVIHENLHQICLIFRDMCFTIYGLQKALFLRNFFHKTLPNISNLYVNVSMHQRIMYGSLWGPPVHGSIDILDWETLSEGFFYDHLVRIGATFRDYKLIVGHIN